MPDFDDELLSAYVDGDLDEAERAEVEAALAADPVLAARREELLTLKTLAREAGPVTLRRDLWPEIRAAVARRPPWWAAAWEALRQPALAWTGTAAACAVLVLVVGQALLAPEPAVVEAPTAVAKAPAPAPEGDVEAARAAYLAAIQRLAQTAESESARLPPKVQEKLRSSLAQVDAAIDECERALAAVSGDPVGHEALLALYDKKIRVLRAAIRTASEQGVGS